MKTVKFRITELCDSAKSGSEIRVGGEYVGDLSNNGIKIYYTDSVGTEWVFWIGDTCEVC